MTLINCPECKKDISGKAEKHFHFKSKSIFVVTKFIPLIIFSIIFGSWSGLAGEKTEQGKKVAEKTQDQLKHIGQPSNKLNPLLSEISSRRNNNGGIVIFGKISLPKETKLMFDLVRGSSLKGQTDVFVSNDSGYFESGPFTDGGKPHPAGTYKVKIVAYFTKIWQSPKVLAQVGENGSKLPASTLKPDDPEFPKAGGHLEIISDITFPTLSLEIAAIQSVKNAKLTVTGKGQSADPIKNVVAYFEKAGGFKALQWSGKKSSSGAWIITLDCTDAGQRKQAQWEFDQKTKKVKYLDPLSKLLSWLPAE